VPPVPGRPSGQRAVPPPPSWASPGRPAWQAQPYGLPDAQPAKKSKALRIVLFCLLGAALLGAGAYFGFFYRGGFLNSGPEKEINVLFEDFTAAVKTGDYETAETYFTPDLLAWPGADVGYLIDTVEAWSSATVTLDDLNIAGDETSAVGAVSINVKFLGEFSALYEMDFEKIDGRWLIADVIFLESNFPFDGDFSFDEDFPFEESFPFDGFESFEDFESFFVEPEAEVPVARRG
jgi:hypothetical protein